MNLEKLSQGEEKIERELHVSVYIIAYKFLLGMLEFSAGLTIALFGSQIYQWYQSSLIKELSEDPHDLLARLSEGLVPNFLAHNTYVVVYLVVLGLAKIVGAIGLVFKQNWGVDLLVVLTILMAPFQIANLIFHPHVPDLIFLVVGLVIAFYLIEFRPRAWISRLILRFSRGAS